MNTFFSSTYSVQVMIASKLRAFSQRAEALRNKTVSAAL